MQLAPEKTEIKKDIYSRAVDFYNKGRFFNAEKCCKKSIAENPNNYEAYNMLGIIASKADRGGEAFNYFKKSIEINPQYAEGYNSLGSICIENKSYDESVGYFKKALELNNLYVDAYYNLGTALKKMGRIYEAIKFYKSAISVNPQYSNAYINIGNIIVDEGDIYEGLEYYKLGIKTGGDSTPSEVYVNTANNILYTEGVIAWKNILLSYLKDVKFSDIQKGELLTSLAIAEWISGVEEYNKYFGYLDESKQLILQNPAYQNFEASITYNDFLRNLIAWYQQNHKSNRTYDKTFHFIGDSHSITCANQNVSIGYELYHCKTHFIRGCKIWHLVKGDNNKYKVAFNREIASLAEEALLVLNVGEIDCRYDNGLFLRYRKYGTNLESEVNLLLDKYFIQILDLVKEKKITPVIWGIPAPHQNVLDKHVHHSYKEEFIQFIEYFNQQMLLRAKQYSLKFIDNYRLTVNDKKQSDKETHLDNFHLKPSVFLKAIQDLWQ